MLEQVAGSLSNAGQAYAEAESFRGTVTGAGRETEPLSNRSMTTESQISALETLIEQLANMAADSTASLNVVEASVSGRLSEEGR